MKNKENSDISYVKSTNILDSVSPKSETSIFQLVIGKSFFVAILLNKKQIEK
jgi:hypothetical protein